MSKVIVEVVSICYHGLGNDDDDIMCRHGITKSTRDHSFDHMKSHLALVVIAEAVKEVVLGNKTSTPQLFYFELDIGPKWLVQGGSPCNLPKSPVASQRRFPLQSSQLP